MKTEINRNQLTLNYSDIKKIKGLIDICISKKLNILFGAGASSPAISTLECTKEPDKILESVAEVSKILLETDDFSDIKSDNDNFIKNTYETYYNFLNVIINLINKSNSRENPKLVNIFTTNYDLFIEKASDKLMQSNNFVLNDGSIGYFNRKIDVSNFNQVIGFKGLNDNYTIEVPTINLLKPHGSINWIKSKSNEHENQTILVTSQIIQNSNEQAIIKPNGSENKDIFLNDHFFDMLRVFQIELDKPQSILFVIGFSFGDIHIRKMVIRALRNKHILVYICLYNEEAKKTIFENMGWKDNEFPNNVVFIDNSYVEFLANENQNDKFTLNDLVNILNYSFKE